MKYSNSNYILSLVFSNLVFVILIIAICSITEFAERKKTFFLVLKCVVFFLITVNLLTMKITEIEIKNNVFYITLKPFYGCFPMMNTCEIVPFATIKNIKFNRRLGYLSIVHSIYRECKREYKNCECTKCFFSYGIASEKLQETSKIYNHFVSSKNSQKP